MVVDEAPDIEPDVQVMVQCADFARVLMASGEQRLRDCQAMSEPSVARHRPLDRDLPANLNDRVTRKWDGRTGRLRAGRVSAPLDSKKVLGVLFLDLYCAFHSASQVHRQASSGMSESCP